MDNLDFSEEEIQEQLSALGYKNIPRHRLCEFKQDLDDLVRRGEWKSFASSAGMNSATSQPSPPAYTKEKVGPCYFENSGHGFFLHAGKVEHDRQVISCDSYARHSVALNLEPPYGPTRGLQVEEEEPPPPDPDESLHPALTDSYASTPDSHRGRYIKRKVLRKHEGRSLVCDESVYSEEDSHLSGNMHKTHNAYRPPEDDDQNSLSSSFWSDGDRREEEEEEEEEETAQVVGEEEREPVSMSEDESKPFGDAEDSLQEPSEEKDSESFSYSEDSLQEEEEEESTPVGGAGDPLEEEEEEEEEESTPVGGAGDSEQEDDSNPLSGSEDSYCEDPEEEIERFICEKESTPGPAREEDSPQEEEDSRPREEKPEVNHQVTIVQEGSGGGHEEDDEEDDDSPAQSLMTSGYGTFQPEELDGGDDRDDRTIAGFDHDSRGDPSETRDDEEEEDEDDRSLGWFDLGPSEPRGPHVEVDTVGPGGDKGPCAKPETGPQVCAAEDKVGAKNSEGGSGDEEGKQQETKSRDAEDEAESSSNKDIKFIDSKVDVRHSEWDGNLRQKKTASGLEERLAGLQLSSSGQSSETDQVSFSALESYIGGLTRSRSDGDLRPKPKSFIRPAMSQQTIKKTDPVAKYFKYKQLWETFTLPGDGDRRSLRSELKERLAYQPPAPKPRRTYVPNSYVVPTEKKRSALRWELRNALASGLLPHTFRFQP